MAFSNQPLRLLVIASAILTFAANVSGQTSKSTAALEGDPFYRAPRGLRRAAPGSILRYRDVPSPIVLNTTKIPMEHAWQILYRTQNSAGKPEAALMTLIKPNNAKSGHLFSQSYFTNAAYAGCAPSLSLQQGGRKDNTFIQSQIPAVLAALKEGWYISIADDNGPQGAYMAGLQMGYATLDSIRAVQKSSNFTGIAKNATITLNGYSGGGISAAWATELQPSYAPELNITGAAIGGIIPNFTAIVEYTSELDYGYLTVPAIMGISHDYPDLTTWLDANLIQNLTKEFKQVERQCFGSNSMYEKKKIGSYFKRGVDSILRDAVPVSVFKNAGLMGQRGTPKIPWFLYEAVIDKVAPTGLASKLNDQYCKAGARIEYQRNTINVTHLEEGLIGFKDAFLWVRDRQYGKPVAAGCKETFVTVKTLSSVALDLLVLFPPEIIPVILSMFAEFF